MEKKRRFIINAVYYALIILPILVVLYFLLPVVTPFIVAFVIAALVTKLAGWIAGKLRLPQKSLVLLLTALFYFVIFAAIVVGGSRLIVSAGNFLASLPGLYTDQVLPLLNELFAKMEEILDSADPMIASAVENSFQQLTENLGQIVSSLSVNALRLISGYASGIPSFFVTLVITVVATFFMAADFERILGFFKKIIPERGLKICRAVKDSAKNFFFVFIKSYSFLMFLTFVELTIGFLILGIPFAGWIALGIAIFDILPVLGTGGILLPWAVILCIMGNYGLAIGILILYVVITAIRNTLEPRIVGKQIGLHPLVTLMSLFIGVKLYGLVGLVCLPVGISIFYNMVKTGTIKQLLGKEASESEEGVEEEG